MSKKKKKLSKRKNPVAKFMPKIHKPRTHKDRTKYDRKRKIKDDES